MFELFKVLRRRNAVPTRDLFDTTTLDCRVGLTDIDYNLHLNNVKYLKYLERARLENLLANGLLWRMINARVNAVVANTEISYLRELRTWQRFSVSARIVGWDEKFFYFEQRFESDGKLCTHAFVRLASLHNGKSIPMAQMLERVGLEVLTPPLPEPVLRWQDLLAAKRNHAKGLEHGQAMPAAAPGTATRNKENRHVA